MIRLESQTILIAEALLNSITVQITSCCDSYSPYHSLGVYT